MSSERSSLMCTISWMVLLAVMIPGIVHAADADDDLSVLKSRLLNEHRRVDIAEVNELLGSMGDEGSWPDIDYADSTRSYWTTANHLSRLQGLTRALWYEDSPRYDDQALRERVMVALDWWLDHDYRNPNWWWNQIGVPNQLGPVLLILEDDLTASQIEKGLVILRRSGLGMTGQNLVWVALITMSRGVLQHDPAVVDSAVTRIADEIRISPDEGIQADFSFYQHGKVLYTHGYGAGFALDCSRTASFVAGTRFAFPPEKIALLENMILDGHRWMWRCGMSDYGARGREISRKGIDGRYLSRVASIMLFLTADRHDDYRRIIDASDSAVSHLTGNRHFWRSDIMTHHRNAYYTSARFFSTRLSNTDNPHNEEGLKSHHIADGCNFIFRDGSEYRDIFPVWNWSMVPGTTVVQTPALTGKVRRDGESEFAGGVSDGMYGVTACDFRRDGLMARKSWFFFDDEYVCLGAGIRNETPYPVYTTINQCHMRSDVEAGTDSDTKELSCGSHVLTSPGWVYQDSVLYVFPEKGSIHVSADAQEGSWYSINHALSSDVIAEDVFSLWIDHGVKPTDASYEYIVRPGIAANDASAYSKRLPVTIVANESAIQAVWHDALKTGGAVFYEPGEVIFPNGPSCTVDMPCIILLRDRPGTLEISVSNPVNRAVTVTVDVDRVCSGAGVSRGQRSGWSQVTIDLPGGLDAGSTVTRSVTVR